MSWIVGHPSIGELRTEQRAVRQNRVGALLGQAVEDCLVDLGAVDGQRERTANAHILQQRPPDRVGAVEVRQQRQARALRLLPQKHLDRVPLLGILEESIVDKVDARRLKVAFARARLRRDQRRRADVEHELVYIGKLQPVLVDAVEVGVALKDELFGRKWRRVAPWIERRKLRILRAIGASHAHMELAPLLDALLLHQSLELVFFLIFLVELLEIG
ncbi:hypothetical protein D9M70_514290 [compost metagenome]